MPNLTDTQLNDNPSPTANPAIRIAIDLDGVLTEHPRPLAQAASTHFGLDLPDRAFVDSAGLHVPDAVREWVYSPNGPARDLRSAPGAVAFITRLQELVGPENVFIVTARPPDSADMTRAWLAEHGFPPIAIHFADEKVSVAQANGATIAIEDSIRHAHNYAAAGLTCCLLASGDAGTPIGPIAVLTPEQEQLVVATTNLVGAADYVERLVSGNTPLDAAAPGTQVASISLDALGERPKIVVSDQIHPLARERLSASADLVDVDGTNLPALLEAVADADALVVRSETQVTAEVIAAASKLRVIARAGVGVDNIDLDAATAAGILVLNAPGANAVSAGEHTIALLLALTRTIIEANASLQAGRWDRKKFKPMDLRGRTAGIVGLGHVGSVVAQRLKAFEMDVIAYDPLISPQRFEEVGVRPVSLDELLATSDVVTFHVPATPETTHLLNGETIQKLKPGAIVINAARGEIVDQEALAEALKSGHVAKAAIDVFPTEPTTASPLFGLPNVVVTPHIGGSSPEALAAIGEVISTTTLAALRGEAVPNAVNLPAASLEAPALRRLSTIAGAAGKLLAILAADGTSAIRLTVQGNVPGDVADHVLGAALATALQTWTGRRVTPVNARLIASELGIALRIVQDDNDPERVPEFTLTAAGDPPHRVTVRWDRVNAEIIEIDRFPFERGLAGDVLITHHTDQPGMIGRLGTVLGRHGVNIAGMQVGRHRPRGEAIMVLNVDDPIPPEALEEIGQIEGVGRFYVVSLPEAELTPVQAALPTPEFISAAAGGRK